MYEKFSINFVHMTSLQITLFNKERMYLSYVLVITAAHMIGAAHQVHFLSINVKILFQIMFQILWLVATVTENRPLNTIAQYSVCYYFNENTN